MRVDTLHHAPASVETRRREDVALAPLRRQRRAEGGQRTQQDVGGRDVARLEARAAHVLDLRRRRPGSAGSPARASIRAASCYTAPVFWLFIGLTGVALCVLRRRDPGRLRPFCVPLFPLTPLVFCATSGYLIYSSLAYAGIGALAGVAVLAAGVLVLCVTRP